VNRLALIALALLLAAPAIPAPVLTEGRATPQGYCFPDHRERNVWWLAPASAELKQVDGRLAVDFTTYRYQGTRATGDAGTFTGGTVLQFALIFVSAAGRARDAAAYLGAGVQVRPLQPEAVETEIVFAGINSPARAATPETQEANRGRYPFLYWAYRQIDEMFLAVDEGKDSFRLGDDRWYFDLPLRWWREHFATPPSSVLTGLARPVLILHGEEDHNVPPADAHEAARLLRSGGASEVSVHVFPGLEHSFKKVAGGETSCFDAMANPVDRTYYDVLTAWLRDKLRP